MVRDPVVGGFRRTEQSVRLIRVHPWPCFCFFIRHPHCGEVKSLLQRTAVRNGSARQLLGS